MTPAERRLWWHLDRIPVEETHFRRQAPVGPYVVDFVCHRARLIIEVDGSQHGFDQNRRSDEVRTEWLEAEGSRVMRFWNHEVLGGIDVVLDTIYAALYMPVSTDHPADTPTPDPSPQGGGERSGNDPDDYPAWPDLCLIDGGKGQLDAARQALAEVGVGPDDVTLVGIAKGRDRDAGRETFFKLDGPPFRLPPRDPALYFVQRLRDEAHRFAIGAHRAKRKREMAKNPLDEISGIGPTRKRALLHHFGTVKAIQRAALEDLMKTPGVNAATARAVYDFFHG